MYDLRIRRKETVGKVESETIYYIKYWDTKRIFKAQFKHTTEERLTVNENIHHEGIFAIDAGTFKDTNWSFENEISNLM